MTNSAPGNDDRKLRSTEPPEDNQYGEVKVNVDTVLLTMKDDELCVVLAPRSAEFENGKLALVGAIMDGKRDEDLDAVVRRSLLSKAGLENIYFEQLFTFSGKSNKNGGKRDTRWPSVSVAYIALVSCRKVMERSDQLGLRIVPVDHLPPLPFDHEDMINSAVRRLRGKGAWSVLPAFLLDDEFTIPELNKIYQKIVGDSALGQNFRRKVLEHGMLEETETKRPPGSTKHAKYYRVKPGVITVDARL